MHNYFNNFLWYPPAETKLPLSAYLSAILFGQSTFEQTLCKYFGVEQCVLANSGRAILYLLLDILKEKGNGSRREVLIPGYSCYSVAAAIAKANLKIKIYDLDPKTLDPDINSLRKNASNQTLAILSQHLFGIPASLQELHAISRDVGAYHLEDAAQAFGGISNDTPIGANGDFGIFSFGRGKPLPIGCGGALIGKDIDLLKKLTITKSGSGYFKLIKIIMAQLISSPIFYWIAETLPLGLGKTVFDPDFNIFALPLQVSKFAEKSIFMLQELNIHRNQISQYYNKAFNEKAIIPVKNNEKVFYPRYPLIVDSKPITNELKRLGVRRMYPKAIFEEKSIRPFFAVQQEPTPGASEIAKRLITLPTHKGINKKLADIIVKEVKESYSC